MLGLKWWTIVPCRASSNITRCFATVSKRGLAPEYFPLWYKYWLHIFHAVRPSILLTYFNQYSSYFAISVCRTVVDLGFLIDGSGSIEYHGRGNFRLMLDFIKSNVVTLPISRTQSRVGAVLFSTSPIPLFRFGQLNTITHVQQAIDSIRYPRGKTYIGKALAYTRRFLFSGRRRRNRKRILIMLTDGISQDRVARQASLLKAKGVEVFAVGIGRALKRRQLLQIATDRNHISVVSFRGLAALSKMMRSKICQLVRPTGKDILLIWVRDRCRESGIIKTIQ